MVALVLDPALTPVVADACFLINLIATRRAEDLLRAVGSGILLPEQVYDEVRRDRGALDGLRVAGVAVVLELPPECHVAYAAAASEVDDGEAAALALALVGRHGFATDDDKARLVWEREAWTGAPPILGICELLQMLEAGIGAAKLSEMLVAIRDQARFDAPRRHSVWWHARMRAR